ncbi:T9SS type A sorting domain-containing protein [Rhodohalobacter mucosus]|uniref:LTD domain-containing protein n=1 Tax=Rhodohalobacter mucosus TaxID=2079485 RepID=A0A316TX33_9BACT|nr:T9SS type A sorting domain-containing protein [Rhodohalobacter mucosus]PWN07144.1 hypothetical protein DDZ15_07730 [Rhodohalobacter mucosus]
MGVMLPFSFTRIAALTTVLLSIFFSGNLQAQVALTDASLFRVSFTLGETMTDNGRAVLSVDDMAKADASLSYVNVNGPARQAELPPYFYLELANGRVAVSALNPSGTATDNNVYAYLPLINETDYALSGLNAAFDFLYRANDEMRGELTLQVKTGTRPWLDVAGSKTRLSDLSSDGPDEWQSFSIQTTIDNIYTRQGDSIEFRWVLDSAPGTPLPLVIQAIEVRAETTVSEPLEPGSLIITEIFAGPDQNGSEYIELYNPTASSVSLTGLSVRSGDNSFVVQRDEEVKPYSYYVLAESGMEPILESTPRYLYYGRILSSGSGFIELYMGGEEAARAAYDISEPFSSVELGRTISGFDGYSSMQDFNSSMSDLGNGMNGSPGYRGNSVRHFSTMLEAGHPYLASIPGLLPESMNRLLYTEAQILNLDGEAVRPGDMLPGQPYLFRSGQTAQQIRLFAEESAAALYSGGPLKTAEGNSAYSFLTLPPVTGLTLSGLINEFSQPVVPAVQVWDPDKERFDVIYSDDVELNSWNAMIINENVPQPLEARTGTASRAPLERMITFSLYEEDGSSEILRDQSYLTFMPGYWTESGRRYDLPKLLPLSADVQSAGDKEISLFYLRNAESNQQGNSFTHLPFEPSQDYRISADLRSTKRSMQTVLRWSLTDEIPDEWEITLTDRFTGQQIDMRGQSSYRYRHAAGDLIVTDEDAEGSSPVSVLQLPPQSDDRFSILISPYESPLGLQEEAEQPGSVELRQNYPNPFNPATNIVYFIPDNRQIKIGVYNVVGQQVATLVDEVMSAGEHTATWNASDMPSGIYIVQLESGNQVFTRKITLIK